MKGKLVALLLIGALALATLPFGSMTLSADDAAWTAVKGTSTPLSKDNPISPVYKAKMISGDYIDLPVGNGKGLQVLTSTQKVLVDPNCTGKVEFNAAQGEKSSPFSVTLVYASGEKVKQSFLIFGNGGGAWYIRRNSGMSYTIDGVKFLALDENCNGIYGEENEDGLYGASDSFGIPLGRLVLANGKIYEIQINESGTELKYKPFTGALGNVDIFKEWGGKTNPNVVCVKGTTGAGTAYFNVAAKGPVPVPQGSYVLVRAYGKEVEIMPGNTSFQVGEGETATMKWGSKLEIRATVNVDSAGGKFSILPMPKVFGCSGEQYLGSYIENPRFAFSVTCCNANGQPIGKAINWMISAPGGSGG